MAEAPVEVQEAAQEHGVALDAVFILEGRLESASDGAFLEGAWKDYTGEPFATSRIDFDDAAATGSEAPPTGSWRGAMKLGSGKNATRISDRMVLRFNPIASDATDGRKGYTLEGEGLTRAGGYLMTGR